MGASRAEVLLDSGPARGSEYPVDGSVCDLLTEPGPPPSVREDGGYEGVHSFPLVTTIASLMASPQTTESDWTWRRRFSICTVLVTVVLLIWGAVVTSIGAGMAFPDWPSSLGSYNLLNPVEGWWLVPAYLAEHGHRLVASLVGVLTVGLTAWTWWADPRPWMHKLGIAAVVLVVLQGVLGGLRVLWVSIDLAMVHACVAQLFFALLVAMTLFVTDTWREGRDILPRGLATDRLRHLAYTTAGVIYVQIVLGALLRHPGAGLAGDFTAVHVTGAFFVVGLVLAVFVVVEKYFDGYSVIRHTAWVLLGAMALQFALGLAALLVMLYDVPGPGGYTARVILTVAHLVVGALLFGTSVIVALLVARRPRSPGEHTGSGASEPALAGFES